MAAVSQSFREKLHRFVHHQSPARVLVIGFASLIFIGTLLLLSPAAVRGSVPTLDFMQALFTATSAVCVTGLSVFDPGSTLSLYGQTVLICLIQIGGLGFMTLTAFFLTSAKRSMSLEGEVLLRESLSETGLHGLTRLAVRIVGVTVFFEAIGALLCMFVFIPQHGIFRGVFLAVFHAVSSFCNAGFDVLGRGDNLVPYVSEPLINVVTMVLIVMGGLGFFVILECWDKGRARLMKWLQPKKHREWIAPLSLQSRLVLTLTAVLITAGFLIYLAAEGTNPLTLGAPDDTWQKKILGSLFQSITTRTAGFMTFPQGDMRSVSKIATVMLMFVGACPAGTAGGVKTTTAAIVFMYVRSVLKGQRDVNIWHHRVHPHLIARAVATFVICFFAIVMVAAAISVLQPELALPDIIFETSSAFGTAGLSTGITASLSVPSQLLIIVTMLGGRVGFFTLTVALAAGGPVPHVRYPYGRLTIG
ncbi:MAG: Trk family potassium uptake protein [Clostridia bacterium]|nr:Trk family potassium uptake protein [Clostridia bacterium]